MKLKEKFERKGELVGIDEISDYTGRLIPEIMRLHFDHGFPMEKNGSKVWHTTKGAIRD